MRVFLAIEFPEDIKDYLAQVQQLVREQSVAGNFTLRDNFHLTLRFIGEIELEELEKLKTAVDRAALHSNNFQLILNKLGQFPRGRKQIIWVGIQPNEELNQLYNNLAAAMERQGYPPEEKTYVPHITLGRQVVLKEELNIINQRLSLDKVTVPVSKISLMESTRIKGRLTYIPIYTQKFNL